VKDSLLYVERHPLGGPKKRLSGRWVLYRGQSSLWRGVHGVLERKAEDQKESDKTLKRSGQEKSTLPYPANDELRAEGEEAKPELYFVIYDDSGAAIRRVNAAPMKVSSVRRGTCGIRHPRCGRIRRKAEDFPRAGSLGPLVLSGNYSVRLFQKVNGTVSELAGAQSFKVVAEGSSSLSREAQEEFQRKVARLYRAVSGAIHTGEDLETRLKAIRTALHETPTIEKELGATADTLEQRNREILRVLRGDQELAENGTSPCRRRLMNRVNSIMEGERFALTKPTQTHLDAYNIGGQ